MNPAGNPAAPVPGTYYVENPNGATVFRPGNDISINIPTNTIITIAADAANPQPNLVIGTYINLAGDSIAIILSHAIMEAQRILPEEPIAPNGADAMSHHSSNNNSSNHSSNNNSNHSNNNEDMHGNNNEDMHGGKLRKRKQRKTRKTRKPRKIRKQKSNRKSRRARRRN